MRALRLLPLFVYLGVLALAPTAMAEPFFPLAGSHAYDVRHYDVHLAYGSSGRVRAVTTIAALAERVSGRNLEALFDRWLYQRGKPR